MEREWLQEAEQGEVALEAEAPAAERPSMLSRLASWRAPAAEAPTVEVHAPQGPLGIVFERSSTVLSRVKDSSPLLNNEKIFWLDDTEILYEKNDDGNVPFRDWPDCIQKAMLHVKPGMGAVAKWSNMTLYIKKGVPTSSRHANRKRNEGFTTFWRKPAMKDITGTAKSSIDGIREQIGEG